MNASWAETMALRLRQARMAPPTAEVLRPLVAISAGKAARAAALRGQAPTVAVNVAGNQVRVTARGPGASRAIAAVREDLGRSRAQMAAAARAAAEAKVRGR